MNRLVSLAVLLAFIALLGGMFYQVVAPFLLPIFLAAVMAVICQPVQEHFLRRLNGRRAWAAAMSTVTVVAAGVIPLGVGTCLAALNLYTITDQTLEGDWRNGVDVLWTRLVEPGLAKIGPYVPGGLSQKRLDELQADLEKNMQSLATQLAGRTFSLATSTIGLIASLTVAAGIFITAFYYFLADGPEILAAARELIPLPADHQEKLAARFAATVRAVVLATFLAAFAQGLATALALKVCGFGHFLILLVVASIASLIPLAGAWMVWGPCAIWLALHGQWFAAIGLTIWGIGVVGMLDNGVKMYVLQSEADLHPLLAFISVIGALQVIGLWGIFVGPIVASCLFALLQIFNAELKALALERESTPPPVTQPTNTVADEPASTSPPPSDPPSEQKNQVVANSKPNPRRKKRG